MKSRNKTFWTLWKYIYIYFEFTIFRTFEYNKTITIAHNLFRPHDDSVFPTANKQQPKQETLLQNEIASFCFLCFASFHSMAIFFVFFTTFFAIKDRLHEKFGEPYFRVCHCGCRRRMEMIKTFISMKISTRLLVVLSIPKICRRDYGVHDILLHFFVWVASTIFQLNHDYFSGKESFFSVECIWLDFD